MAMNYLTVVLIYFSASLDFVIVNFPKAKKKAQVTLGPSSQLAVSIRGLTNMYASLFQFQNKYSFFFHFRALNLDTREIRTQSWPRTFALSAMRLQSKKLGSD